MMVAMVVVVVVVIIELIEMIMVVTVMLGPVLKMINDVHHFLDLDCTLD